MRSACITPCLGRRKQRSLQAGWERQAGGKEPPATDRRVAATTPPTAGQKGTVWVRGGAAAVSPGRAAETTGGVGAASRREGALRPTAVLPLPPHHLPGQQGTVPAQGGLLRSKPGRAASATARGADDYVPCETPSGHRYPAGLTSGAAHYITAFPGKAQFIVVTNTAAGSSMCASTGRYAARAMACSKVRRSLPLRRPREAVCWSRLVLVF